MKRVIQSKSTPDVKYYYSFHKEQINKLITSHKKTDNPPILTIWFKQNDKKDIYLFEVAENVPDTYKEEGKLFCMEFKSTPSFMIATNGSLRLYWLSENDLSEAIKKRDVNILQVANDLKTGEAECIYANKKGNKFLKQLQNLQKEL